MLTKVEGFVGRTLFSGKRVLYTALISMGDNKCTGLSAPGELIDDLKQKNGAFSIDRQVNSWNKLPGEGSADVNISSSTQLKNHPLNVLCAVTAGNISWHDTLSWTQRLHYLFVLFCCFWPFLGHVVGFFVTLSGHGDLCTLGLIIPGWNYIRTLHAQGVSDDVGRQLLTYTGGLVNFLCLLAFASRNTEVSKSIDKFYMFVKSRQNHTDNMRIRCSCAPEKGVTDKSLKRDPGYSEIVKVHTRVGYTVWICTVVWALVAAIYFQGWGFHKRPPYAALEVFDLIFMIVTSFFSFGTFFHMAGLYHVIVEIHLQNVRELSENIHKLSPVDIVGVDKTLHMKLKFFAGKLGFYLALCTAGSNIMFWGVVANMSTMMKEKAACRVTSCNSTSVTVPECLKQLQVATLPSVDVNFYLARSIFMIAGVSLWHLTSLYKTADVGTQFLDLTRKLVNFDIRVWFRLPGKSTQGIRDEVLLMNSHFQMRAIARNPGLVLFNVGVDFALLSTLATLVFTVAVYIWSWAQRSSC